MNKRKLGKEYETAAKKILEKSGYMILEENYRCPRGEIDLIAMDNGELVFLEVKYRSSTGQGLPEEAVDLRKRKRISRTAQWYMMEKRISPDVPCRFDVVSVLRENIRIYKNAFDFQR
ncbi:MAG: YraN family protein [Ruminococcus sp.]|jgi:putative endonuclease